MLVFGGYGDPSGAVRELQFSPSPTWSELAVEGYGPGPRYGHGTVFDEDLKRMVVFGGTTNGVGLRNDTWFLHFDQPTPTLLSLVSVEVHGDRVDLRWHAPEGTALPATVWRRTSGEDWVSLARVTADGTGMLWYRDEGLRTGERYAYRLEYPEGDIVHSSAETWVDVPLLSLALYGLRPNPASGPLTVSFALPTAAPALLELLDVAGRSLIQREVGSLGTGPHLLRLDDSIDIAPGLYWTRLSQSGRTLTARGAVVR
ncbi:MAG: hypothetical protein ABIS67_09750 [Candidatus Eisenbacteria bacterium]